MNTSPYAAIRALKDKTGARKVNDLLAMSPMRDPFYSGTPGDQKKAEWFAEIWDKFANTNGAHLRRVHYQVLSHANIAKPNGKLYINDDASWEFLTDAAASARYLGLVDPELIIDRRNPDPHLNIELFEHPPVGWVPDWGYWVTPSIDISMDLDLPAFKRIGYDYSNDLQPYHIEIWAEKSTQNDILEPICRHHGVNLVTGLGYMSITSVIAFLNRVQRSGKPAVIIYVSDFDVSGAGMPRQVARQIEFWKDRYCPEFPIQLEPVVLTKDQVVEYDLPLNKIKGDPGAVKKFRRDFKIDGTAELDALEALHPGELGKVIKQAIDLFQDIDLQHKYRQAGNEANAVLQAAWENVVGPYESEIQDLEEKIREAGRKHIIAFNEEIGPILAELETLQLAVASDISFAEADLPERPDAEVRGLGHEPFFDSARSYTEQLGYYKNSNGRWAQE